MSRVTPRLFVLFLTIAGLGQAAAQTGSPSLVKADVPASTEPQYVSPSGTRYFAEADSRGLVAQARERASYGQPRLDTLVRLGDAFASTGDYKAAIEAYTRALVLDPEDATVYQRRGHRRLSRREFDLAAADLERAVKLDAGLGNAWFYLGISHYLAGRWEKAAECFQQVVDANRDDVATSLPALDWQVLSYKRAHLDDKAAAVLARVEPDTAVEGSLRLSLARLLFYKGLRTEADLLASVRDDADRATLVYGIGAIHAAAGRDQDATRLFKMAVGTSAWSTLGFIAAERDLAR